VSRGFVFQPRAGDLFAESAKRVSSVFDRQPRVPDARLEDVIRRELEEYLYKETKRRPMVIPVLHKVGTWEKL